MGTSGVINRRNRFLPDSQIKKQATSGESATVAGDLGSWVGQVGCGFGGYRSGWEFHECRISG
jgi:hypothetical protein